MSSKKKINVYLVNKDIIDEGNYIFNKVYIEIWKRIKEKLKHKYIFIEKTVDANYPKHLKELSGGKFDILVSAPHNKDPV